MPPKVSLSDLEHALLWTKDPTFDTEAYVSRETGEVIFIGGDDPMPVKVPKKELRIKKKYIPTPLQNDLINARRLLFDFIEEHLPDQLENVQDNFHHAGAWGRTKTLLQRKGKLNDWHQYENEALRTALREWAEENGFSAAD